MNFNDVYKKMALLESDASSCGCGSDCKCGGKCGGKCGDDNCPCECGKNTGVEETKKKEKTTESSKKNRGRQLYEEAQIDVSINGLSSTDAETLSQMLHLAGIAQQGGGGDMGMDPMGGDMGMDPMGNPVSAMTPGIDDSGMDMGPMNGDTLGTGDMAAFDQEGPMDMHGGDMGMDGDDDYHDHEDYEGGFDAEMGAGMEIEPADDMGAMSADDDAAVASTWDNEPDEMDASIPPSQSMATMNGTRGDAPEEELEDDFDVNDLLQLSGMKRLPENDEEDKVYDNEPDEESSSDYSDLPTGGPNKKKSKSQGAPEAVKTIAVKERAERLKRKLAAAKG